MRKIFLLSILVFFVTSIYSQKIVSVSNPLEEYFQKNYDSTIFLYESSYIQPNIYIVSKKGNKLYNYRYLYHTPVDEDILEFGDDVGPLNERLKDVFRIRLETYKNTKPSINQYFSWFSTDSINNVNRKKSIINKKHELEEIKPIWLILQEFNLWNLVDDNNEKLRRTKNLMNPNKNNKKDIFVLITKDEVKKLEYSSLNSPNNEKEETRKKVSEIIKEIWLSLTRIN